MLLSGKVALIWGAGAIGVAVARAFGAAGARVHLAGRSEGPLRVAGVELGAQVSVVEAGDRAAVERLVAAVEPDIAFNALGLGDAQGVPMAEMTLEHFLLPIEAAARLQFLTGVAAAKSMAARGGGVVLGITATPARRTYPNAGGFGVACAAIEAIFRQIAVEFGPRGVRATVLRSAGSPDAPGVGAAMDVHAARLGITRDELEARNSEGAALGRMPRLAEVAGAAVLAASDLGSALTANVLNVTCGGLQE